jgi:hypothetical protein
MTNTFLVRHSRLCACLVSIPRLPIESLHQRINHLCIPTKISIKRTWSHQQQAPNTYILPHYVVWNLLWPTHFVTPHWIDILNIRYPFLMSVSPFHTTNLRVYQSCFNSFGQKRKARKNFLWNRLETRGVCTTFRLLEAITSTERNVKELLLD